MCNLAAKCNRPAAFTVVHKAVGAMPERRVDACAKCAGTVGKGTPDGPLLNTATRESRFYKIGAH